MNNFVTNTLEPPGDAMVGVTLAIPPASLVPAPVVPASSPRFITNTLGLPGDFTVAVAAPPTSLAPVLVTTISSTRIAAPGPILNPFDPYQPLTNIQWDPLYLNAPQTWAQRNPNLGVQKERPRVKATDAAKATKKISAVWNKVNTALLSADMEKQMVLQHTQIDKIAQDHNRKVPKIDKLINHHTNYQHTQGPSLSNALIHKKGLEMNQGMPPALF